MLYAIDSIITDKLKKIQNIIIILNHLRFMLYAKIGYFAITMSIVAENRT